MKNSFLLLSVMALLPACVFAVDGVTLISQSTVMAAGGFPFHISQPGSYKLSGDLSVPSGMNGIEISVPRVTLDLAGFSIATPDPLTFPPIFAGILYNGTATPSNIIIRGGIVDGFEVPIQLAISATGVLCEYCTVKDLIIRVPIEESSLDLGNWTRVESVTALNSAVTVICPSVVVNTVALTIKPHVFSRGDLNPASQGACTFANNATLF